MFENIIILGGGCWGATIADVLSEKSGITLWEYSGEKCEYIKKHAHPESFPFVKLRGVKITNKLKIFPDTDLLAIALPAQKVRMVLVKAAAEIKKYSVPVLILSKGIEIKSMKTLDAVCAEVLGVRHPVAVLSGPSHAEDLSRRRPASVVVASKSAALAGKVQETFRRAYIRPYVSADVRGVSAGGALKNIFAIAAGICDGLSLGINAKAALVTRCLVEMTRLGCSMGGQRKTFSGLSGIGDLMVTSFSDYSRNRNLGVAVGKGLSLEAAKKKVKTTAEGAETARAVHKYSRRKKIKAPIADEVYAILYRRRRPALALASLMKRSLKNE